MGGGGGGERGEGTGDYSDDQQVVSLAILGAKFRTDRRTQCRKT